MHASRMCTDNVHAFMLPFTPYFQADADRGGATDMFRPGRARMTAIRTAEFQASVVDARARL